MRSDFSSQGNHPIVLEMSFSLPSKALFCHFPPAPFQPLEAKKLCRGTQGSETLNMLGCCLQLLENFRVREIEQKRGWDDAPYLDSALLIYSMLKGWALMACCPFPVPEASGPRNNMRRGGGDKDSPGAWERWRH